VLLLSLWLNRRRPASPTAAAGAGERLRDGAIAGP